VQRGSRNFIPMASKDDLVKGVNDYFSGSYTITQGTVVPDVENIQLGKNGRELDLAMLFIDIRESTKIVDGFRRVTAARMYKSFLWGIAQIARTNNGELRSFNGDGVLVAFVGEYKCTNAVKAALQMSWFCKNVLKPKIESYFATNSQLSALDFDFGIGIDVGKVLVVRGGIKGENNNDLVWVGNATNFAVKLSHIGEGYNIYISEDVYKKMNDTTKYTSGQTKENIWELRFWTSMNKMRVYRSNGIWTPK